MLTEIKTGNLDEFEWSINGKEKALVYLSGAFIGMAAVLPEYREFLCGCAIIAATNAITLIEFRVHEEKIKYMFDNNLF